MAGSANKLKEIKMFIILLEFSENIDKASQFMEGHKKWLQQGFEDGVFLLSGNLKTQRGGGIIAHNISLENLQLRIGNDPFVAENVVAPEIIEISAMKADERLDFLLG